MADCMKWLLCFVLLNLFVASQATQATQLLLVVGDVTHNSVRILYQPVGKVPTNFRVHLLQKQGGTVASRMLIMRAHAQVVEFGDLKPDTSYVAHFGTQDDSVEFKTFPLTWAHNATMVVLANIFNSSLDHFGLNTLDLADGFLGTLHLGGQFDATSLPFLMEDSLSYLEMLEVARLSYRKQWGSPQYQTFWRTGAHFMLPGPFDLPKYSDRLNATDLWRQAVRQAFYEFQFLLVGDLKWGSVHNDESTWYWRQIGSIGLVFMDVYMDRDFAADKEEPAILSVKQQQQLAEIVQQWCADDSVTEIILLSSLPLILAPQKLSTIASYLGVDTSAHLADGGSVLSSLSCSSKRTTAIAGGSYGYLEGVACKDAHCISQVVVGGLSVATTPLTSWRDSLFAMFDVFTITAPFSPTWDFKFTDSSFLPNCLLLTFSPENSVTWKSIQLSEDRLPHEYISRYQMYRTARTAMTAFLTLATMLLISAQILKIFKKKK